MKARETYTMKGLNEDAIFNPHGGNHAETNEARLGDVGVSISAERRAVLEHRLARWRREARTDGLYRRQRRCLSGWSIRSGTKVEELHSATLGRGTKGTGVRAAVTLRGREAHARSEDRA
jgi:hypothetical protein